MSENLTLEAFLDSIRKASEKTDPKETAEVQDNAPDPIGLSPCMRSAINSALYNHLEVNFAENADYLDEFEQEAAYDEFDPDYIINHYLTDPEARETLEIYADPAGYESAALLFQNAGFDFADNTENPIAEYIPNKDNFRNAESDIIKEIVNNIDLPADQENKKWTIQSILLYGMNNNMIPLKADDPELSKKWQDTINQAHYQDMADFENDMKNKSVETDAKKSVQEYAYNPFDITPEETADLQNAAPDPIGLSSYMRNAIDSALYDNMACSFHQKTEYMDEFELDAAYDEFDPDYIINNYLTNPEARKTLETYADPAGYESAALLFQNIGFDFTDNKENPITDYIPNEYNYKIARDNIINEITSNLDLPADEKHKKWTIQFILLNGMDSNMIPVKTDDPELSKKWHDTINQAHYQDKTNFENDMKNATFELTANTAMEDTYNPFDIDYAIPDIPRDPDQELENLLNSLQSPADASKADEFEGYGSPF